MIESGRIPNRGGVFIDVYTGYISEEIAATITTRINDANNTYITDEYRQDDMPKQQGGGGYNRASKIESTM